MEKSFKKTAISKVVNSILSLSMLGAGLTLSLLSSPVHAQQNVQSVLVVSTSKVLSKDPVMFNIAGTNKVIIDLFDIDRDTKVPKDFVNDPLVEKVALKIVGERARIIIDTKKPVKFSFVKNGNNVKVILEESQEFENVAVQVQNEKVAEPLIPVEVKKEVVPEVVVKPLEEKLTLKMENKIEVKSEEKTGLTGISPERREEIIESFKSVNSGVKKSKVPTIEPMLPEVKQELPKELVKEEIKEQIVKKEVKPTIVNPSVTPVTSVQAPIGLVFTEIEKINLKNIGNRTARLTVNLSDKSIVPNITKQGNKLVLDFDKVSIPNDLQKRLSVDALSTLTQSLDVSMQKNNGRIILEQKEGWDYSFSQMEKQLVVDIKPAQEKEEAKKYVGKTLSLNFQNMDVRAVLQVIADFTGLNIMSSDTVSGAMTIRLKDVPWDQALDLVLEARNLQKVKDGNVVWIATRQEIADNNKSKLELKQQNEDLEALTLEFFQVNYYKADDLKLVLEGKTDAASSSAGSVRLLSKKGSIGVDPRNNILFIQDTESNLKSIKRLIAKLDIPVKQVLIEAKIVIADDRFGKEIGSRFGLKSRTQDGSNSIGFAGNITDSGSVAGGTASSVTPLTALAAVGSNTVAPGVLGMTLLTATGDALGLELSALEQNNRGKVVSNPRLITTDNKQATIEQGTEIPYVTPGSAGSPATVTFKKAVLSLGVTPQIAPNGKVVMSLKIRKDTIGDLINIQGGGQIPAIDTKNIDTQVTVNDGQTVVLGGVYEITTRNDVSKIPFFGDLPILGNFFKNTNKSDKKGELLIFITPFVVTDVELDQNLPTNIKEVNLRKLN